MLLHMNEFEDQGFNVLVVGSGAREAALALALSSDQSVRNIYVTPGNCGINDQVLAPKVKSVGLDLDPCHSGLIKFCKDNEISLVVPGPEKYIVEGIKEALGKHGIRCLSPSKKAATLEASKSFSKHFMKNNGIPTADFKVFHNFELATNYVKTLDVKQIVIKASGLAGGKGVCLPDTLEEATEALHQILVKNIYGVSEVVIEDRLEGEEVSVICICDGYTAIQLPAAQDHKRIYDNDQGPNTGGMGAYSPVPFYTTDIKNRVQTLIVQKTLDGMRELGAPFVGVLFVGLILTEAGPYVLEYNVRFGDPEAQVVLPLLSETCSLYGIFDAAVESYLDKKRISFRSDMYAVNVVLASGGYPGDFKKCIPLYIPENIPKNHTTILHSGTALKDTNLVADGGRVLSVVSTGRTIDEALKRSYSTIELIKLEGSHYRRDIAKSRNKRLKNGNRVTYKDAGVCIEEADAFIDEIKDIVKSTSRPGVVGSIGSFGSVFDVRLSGYADPILVSGADGVGTKIKIAHECKIYDTIGIDLVAMNVNDVVAMGAEPLFFLDYYSCGSLNKSAAKSIIMGITKGCIESGCALVGGETSEMPGVYKEGEFDLAGFCVGAREREKMYPMSESIHSGDVLIGLLSNGLHSNGYSLVRRILETGGVSYMQKCGFDSDCHFLYEELLRPTRIYVKPVLSAIRKYPSIRSLAHITGGGISSNLKRALNSHSAAVIDCTSWSIPPIFKWLKALGNIDNDELERTFNCGIGMVLVTRSNDAADIVKFLKDQCCPARIIGKIEDNNAMQPSVRFVGMAESW